MWLRVWSPALTGCPCPQSGGECLRAYVSVTLEQVAQWRDEQGHSGLWYVMQVVSQLLDPRTSEFTAAFVGRLVSTLIARAGRERDLDRAFAVFCNDPLVDLPMSEARKLFDEMVEGTKEYLKEYFG